MSQITSSPKQLFVCSPKQVVEYLSRNGFRNPLLEAKLILSEVLNCEFKDVEINSHELFNERQLETFKQFWTELEKRRPIQYQIGYTYVRGLKIQISEEVLCPGSQIESTTAAACQRASVINRGVAVDLCTGSGVIGVVLAKEFPNWTVYGTDISQSALLVAEKNKVAHQLLNLHLLQGDMFAALARLGIEGKVDLIVSNPPYCPTSQLNNCPVQVRDYVPRIAINGGNDGLYFYRRIFQRAKSYLKKGGYLVLEHEVGRSDLVISLLGKKFKLIEALEKKDLGRVIVAQYIA